MYQEVMLLLRYTKPVTVDDVRSFILHQAREGQPFEVVYGDPTVVEDAPCRRRAALM